VRQNGPVDEFDALIAAFVARDGVTIGGGRGFGANALQVDGRIFAMSNETGVVLKLPRDRVAALVASGDGRPFDAGKGRPMKEWVIVPWGSGDATRSLAEEALLFVAAGSRV
jgi:hypothetical protein